MKTTIRVVEEEVLKYYGIDVKDVFAIDRDRHIVEKRQIFYYLCRLLTHESLYSIGIFAGKYRNKPFSHCTVLHGSNQVRDIMKFDKRMKHDVESIQANIIESIPVEEKDLTTFKSKTDISIQSSKEIHERLAQIVASHNELLERVKFLEGMYINALEVV
jgi:hypothetical protein